MALSKEDLNQINNLLNTTLNMRFEEQRAAIMIDMRTLLMPIRKEIENIKDRLDKLTQRSSVDIVTAYEEIESLKKKINTLESRIADLEKTNK